MKNKKKLLFTNFNMEVGGVAKVLINLLNNLDYDKYDVTLYLQFRDGELIDEVNKNVTVKDYNLSKMKFAPLRKIINGLKYFKILVTNYHKYDFAGCFSPPGNVYSSKLVRIGSKNNAIWLHTNIINCVKTDDRVQKMFSDCHSTKELAMAYLNSFRFRKFKKYIFVSTDAMNTYLSLFPEDKDKCILCRNVINYEEMIAKSKEKIEEVYDKSMPIFVNVGRHTESDKRLTRLIEACNKLKKNYKFKVIMVGSGIETDHYKDLVNKYKLTDYFDFVGLKKNPYPYFKLADAFVLTSAFEGFPTTFSEAMVLDTLIITTDVSDATIMIKDKYGIVVANDDTSIYDGMKEYLDNGFKISKKFDAKKANEESINILEDLFNERH